MAGGQKISERRYDVRISEMSREEKRMVGKSKMNSKDF
jgi:hypothetical protein